MRSLLALPLLAAVLLARSAGATPPAPPAPHAAPVVAPHEEHVPATIHLEPASKAEPRVVDFVKSAWTSGSGDRPYRVASRGELPEKVAKAAGDTAKVFVVTHGPGEGKGAVQLASDKRLFIVRHGFTTTIFDADGAVAAKGHDQVPGAGASFQHSESTDWTGKPLGAAMRLPPNATQKPNPLLPGRNPDVRATGGGSSPYTVPLAGTKMRVFTQQAGSFFKGGEQLPDDSNEWGGRLVIPQARQVVLGGHALYVPPRIVNVRPIIDERTGEPIKTATAVEIDGVVARYDPRTTIDARADLSREQLQRLFSKRGPGPLF